MTVECFRESEKTQGEWGGGHWEELFITRASKEKKRPLAPKAVFVLVAFFFEKEVHILRFVGLSIKRFTTRERLAKVGKEIPT